MLEYIMLFTLCINIIIFAWVKRQNDKCSNSRLLKGALKMFGSMDNFYNNYIFMLEMSAYFFIVYVFIMTFINVI